MNICIMNNVYDNQITKDKMYKLSLNNIRTLIENPFGYENKNEAKYLFPFHVKEECLRRQENVNGCDVIMIDYDNGTSFNQVKEEFKKLKIKFFMYTSFNHLIKGSEKFRIILPLVKEYGAFIYSDPVWRQVLTNYFKYSDPQAWKVCGYYAPSYPNHTEGKHYRFYESEYDDLFEISSELLDEFRTKKAEANVRKTKADAFYKKLRRKLKEGEVNDVSKHYLVTRYMKASFPVTTGNGNSNTWLYAALSVCVQNQDQDTLISVINKARGENWTGKEIEQKIKSIQKKVGIV